MDTSYLKAHKAKDIPGLQVIMAHLFPKRTENEVCLLDDIDITDLLKFIDSKNEGNPEIKTTLFHCFIYAITKMINERPKLNRYIQGQRFWYRDKISFSFIVKRRFSDHAEEALMVLVPEMTDVVGDITNKVSGDVKEIRKSEKSTGGIDKALDTVAKIPYILRMLFVGLVRLLDFWGLVPLGFRTGDTNYTTVLLSNLGSIKCPAVYHHLNNYGTNSIMITIGEMHKEVKVMPDGTEQIRDVVSIGVTLDERIADGFYFARSLKLVKHIFAHPEMLDEPIGNPSNFEYK